MSSLSSSSSHRARTYVLFIIPKPYPGLDAMHDRLLFALPTRVCMFHGRGDQQKALRSSERWLNAQLGNFNHTRAYALV